MDITTIIEIVFALIGAIITTVLIPYIRSKTNAKQREEINAWVEIAVLAAEQIYKGQGRGEEKKAHVLTFLADHGILVDEGKIDALIEAAVFDMKNGII
jgi:hypothetical protein